MFSLATCVILMIMFYLLHKYLTRYNNYWKEKGVPYEEPVFLVGSLLEVFKGKRQIGKHLGDLYKKYTSPYFGIYILGKPYLILRCPEIIKTITIKEFNIFSDRSFALDKSADKIAANSLFMLRSHDWRNIRTKLSPIFTSGKLKLMTGIMRVVAENLQEHLSENDGRIMDVKEISAQYMTDLVASCFFGFEANSFKEGGESKFREVSRDMFSAKVSTAFSMLSYFFFPRLVSLFKLKMVDSTYLETVFRKAIGERATKKIRRNDLVDMLLQLKKESIDNENEMAFDDDVVVSQALTFFVAGFETTSNAITFTLYELCQNQDIQDKLRHEINQVIKTEEDITFENVHKIKYLDMVLCETLRVYPFGLFLNRLCLEDYVIEETGLVIEKGTPIMIPIDGIHNDPEYYPEPERYYPERFADGKRQELTQQCRFLPFGSGPRNCIGERFVNIGAKVGLVYFLKDFKVERCDQTPTPPILNQRSPFMTPKRSLNMIIKKVTH